METFVKSGSVLLVPDTLFFISSMFEILHLWKKEINKHRAKKKKI